jgi:membrane protease YdiL (CAAX protease family)
MYAPMVAAAYVPLSRRLFGPQRHRAVPWTIWEIMLLAPSVISGIWQGFLASDGIDKSKAFLIFNDVALLLMLALPFVVVMVRQARLYQLGLHASHFLRYAAIGVVAYFVAAPFVFITNLLALQLFHRTPHVIEEVLKKSPTVAHIIESAVMAVIVAPILEELVFRGILLPWLRRLMGAWPAIVLSSAIFAIAHFNAWPAPIALFVLALFLGYLAHRTTSLVSSIALHATFNAANLALLIIMITNKVPLD